MAQIFISTCFLNSEGKKPHSFSFRWKYPPFGMVFDLSAMKHLRLVFKAYVLGKQWVHFWTQAVTVYLIAKTSGMSYCFLNCLILALIHISKSACYIWLIPRLIFQKKRHFLPFDYALKPHNLANLLVSSSPGSNSYDFSISACMEKWKQASALLAEGDCWTVCESIYPLFFITKAWWKK